MEDLYKRIDSLNDREQGYILKYYCSDGFDNRSKIRNLRYNRIRSLKCNLIIKCLCFMNLESKIISWNIFITFQKTRNYLIILEWNYIISQANYIHSNLKIFKKLKFLEIDFEFRPFINELHTLFTETGKVITKRVVIELLYNLETPRLLFETNNYKKKQAKTVTS